MKTVFYLTGDNVELARAEVLALTNSKSYDFVDRLLITDSDEDFSDRLSLVHSSYKLLFRCPISKLKKSIESFDWFSVYDKDYCVRIIHSPGVSHFVEKEVAGFVWDTLNDQYVNQVNKGVKFKHKILVNLTNAKSVFNFFITNKGVFVCKKLNDIDKSFFDRWPHKRPCFHPTSITSKLARCCVNLSGIKKGSFYDPFCGIGAILIEGGMMGFKAIGSDISEMKLRMCKINLDHYKLKASLFKQDALKLKKNSYDFIMTDPPYNRNEKVDQSVDSFYKSFLMSAYNSLRKNGTLVMLSPHYVNVVKLNPGFKIQAKVSSFVHGSLTRIVFVLKK